MDCICSNNVAVDCDIKISKPWLLSCRNNEVAIGRFGRSFHVLVQLGMLDGKTCAVHWNHVEGFVQQFINVAVDPGIYRANENIWTCAGGSATIGMMLHRVNQDFGGGR